MVRDLSSFVQENPDVLLDALQLALMGCGLIPGAGEVCDGIDAAVSFARGDAIGGILSLGAAVPVAGWLASGLKAWKNSDKFRKVLDIIGKIRKGCRGGKPFRGARVALGDDQAGQTGGIRVGDTVARTADGGPALSTSVSVRTAAAGIQNRAGADIQTYRVVAGGAPVLAQKACGPNSASRPGQIANHFGYTTKQIKDAIHAVKRDGLPRDGAQRNPDVIVDLDTGEVYVKLPDGSPSDDSIGNILEYLPDE